MPATPAKLKNPKWWSPFRLRGPLRCSSQFHLDRDAVDFHHELCTVKKMSTAKHYLWSDAFLRLWAGKPRQRQYVSRVSSRQTNFSFRDAQEANLYIVLNEESCETELTCRKEISPGSNVIQRKSWVSHESWWRSMQLCFTDLLMWSWVKIVCI